MTLQTLKIGRKEFVLLGKRDFNRLAALAEQQIEDDYWTAAALDAEARARAARQTPIPFEDVERELDALRKSPRKIRRRRR